MSNVVFDVLVKFLRYIGYKVTHMSNLTDVDDKIIAKANEEGINALEYSQDRINEVARVMGLLGVRTPDIEPKASENIENIIIKRIHITIVKKIECNPIISIIIPIYNVEEYIIECLESIYNQTYKNIEVILVDDCGSDNSMNIVKEYLTPEKHSFTKIIQHQQNKGLSAARNTGIKHATGDYIYFIDSDDFITPNCIESFYNLIQKYNNPEIIFGSATFYPYQWGNFSLDTNKNELSEYCSNKKNINKYFFNNDYLPVTAWNKLVKKDFINFMIFFAIIISSINIYISINNWIEIMFHSIFF